MGAHPIAATSSTLRLSGDDNNHVYFDGLIDEASLYNRALSASEIAGIYNAGSAGKCGLAPAVQVPPASQTVPYSGNAAFSVIASGTPPLSYQWRFAANPVPGATASSLLLTDVTLANAGSYSVVITNLYGSVTGGPAVLTVLPAPACVPAPAGLVSWWRGEINANDSADSNNGVLEGSVAFVAGEVGQAFALNGINADVRVPASPSLNVGLADGFTIETWINPADVTQLHPLVEWNDGSFGVHLWIANHDGSAGDGSLWIDVKDTSFGDHFFTTREWLLTSNVWQHVAATYSKTTGIAILYINGVQQAQANIGVVTPRTIGDLYLGLRPHDGGAGTRFAGLMDEVSLYNRALSASEIEAIYNASGAGKCTTGTPPFITLQPSDLTEGMGSSAVFRVIAGGTSPLAFQWHFNGASIAGATNSLLVLDNVQLSNTGTYYLVVTNLAGSVTSSNAHLAVVASLPCAPAPSSLVSWWRGEGSALDATGTNNGVLEGGVGFAAGEVNQAFTFNGTSADVRVPASASLNVGLADGFTIETWINPADVTQLHPLVEWNNGSFGVHLWIANRDGSSGNGSLWIDVKDTSFADHFFTTPEWLLASNVWQHVAATVLPRVRASPFSTSTGCHRRRRT